MKNIQDIVAFVQDQFRTREFIPLHAPQFKGNEKKYLLDTIDSTFVSSIGPYVDKFEESVQRITRARKAIATVNGTSALQVALRLAGVKKGDEVITQAQTFVATANAIVYNSATPVFLVVEHDTMGLSPEAVEHFLDIYGDLREDGCYNKITGRRIAACVPMHTFGFPVHLLQLQRVCTKWHIPIVEDAAESLGSYYSGQHTGTFGLLGIFSFNGNKVITCGGGGAIITNDEKLGEEAKYLTTTAKNAHPYEFYHDELGYNFRLPNLNAALACAQLEQLNSFLEKKRRLAQRYSKFFKGLNIKFREETHGTKANYWLMCIELNDKEERERFLINTNKLGVMTRPVWQLMFRLPMYSHCYRDDQLNAIYLEERIVNIPSSV